MMKKILAKRSVSFRCRVLAKLESIAALSLIAVGPVACFGQSPPPSAVIHAIGPLSQGASQPAYPEHVLSCSVCRERLGLPPLERTVVVGTVQNPSIPTALPNLKSEPLPQAIQGTPKRELPSVIGEIGDQPLVRSLTPIASAAMQQASKQRNASDSSIDVLDEPIVPNQSPIAPSPTKSGTTSPSSIPAQLDTSSPIVPNGGAILPKSTPGQAVPSTSLSELPLEVRSKVLSELDVPKGGTVLSYGVAGNSPSQQAIEIAPRDVDLKSLRQEGAANDGVAKGTMTKEWNSNPSTSPIEKILPPEQPSLTEQPSLAEKPALKVPQEIPAPLPSPLPSDRDSSQVEELRQLRIVVEGNANTLSKISERIEQWASQNEQALKQRDQMLPRLAELESMLQAKLQELELARKEIAELSSNRKQVEEELKTQRTRIEERLQNLDGQRREIESQKLLILKDKEALEENQKRSIEKVAELEQTNRSLLAKLKGQEVAVNQEQDKRIALEQEIKSLRSRLAQAEDRATETQRKGEPRRETEDSRQRSRDSERQRAEQLKRKLEEEKIRRSKEAEKNSKPKKEYDPKGSDRI